jgi:hypothetical protein
MGYRILASAALAVHFGYLGYVVLGGFLAWRWPRMTWPHLVAAAWGLVVVTLPAACPLTALEDWARVRSGQDRSSRGFVDRFFEGVLYPERYARLMQALAVAVVLVSYVGLLWRRHSAHRAGAARRGRDEVTGAARRPGGDPRTGAAASAVAARPTTPEAEPIDPGRGHGR